MRAEAERSNARGAVAARREQWGRRLQAELDRMVDVLRQQADVERVVVFGSVARGDVRYRSDLDVVIVRRTADRFEDRVEAAHRLLQPRMTTDILVYTPEEWDAMKDRPGMAGRVCREGKVAYAAGE